MLFAPSSPKDVGDYGLWFERQLICEKMRAWRPSNHFCRSSASTDANIERAPRHGQMCSITSNGFTIREERKEPSNEEERK
jgi:hypothetical protein